MTQSAPIKPYKCFESGYRAYVETALRLVQYELEHIEQYMLPDENNVNVSTEKEKLSAIKAGLQIAMDNIERDYSKESAALEVLNTSVFNRVRYNFGSKTD